MRPILPRIFCTHPRARPATRLPLALLLAALVSLTACARQEDAYGVHTGAAPAPADPPGGDKLLLTAAELPPGIKRLRFGVSPFATPKEHRAQFGPLCAYLSKVLGIPVELQQTASYETLVQQMVDGQIDIALLSPLSYVHAYARQPRMQLVARTLAFGAPEYSAFLLVRADDPAMTLADLQGRRVAWVDPLSTAGYLFPYASIIEQGLTPDAVFAEQRFAGTHDAALAALLQGKVDVAAVSSGTLSRLREKSDDAAFAAGVRILTKSGRIPYDALAVGPQLSRDAARKIGWAFMGLSTRTAEGRQILLRTWGLSGWVPAENSAYDGVRAVLAAVERAEGRPASLPNSQTSDLWLELQPPQAASPDKQDGPEPAAAAAVPSAPAVDTVAKPRTSPATARPQ